MTPERHAFLRHILDTRQPDLTVALEGVGKPHNLAAIARSADAVGVMQVHAVTAEPHLRLTMNAASGAGKYVTTTCHESTADCVAALKADGFQIAAADLADHSVDYREVDFTRPTALFMGEEKPGLSDEAREKADLLVHSPMTGAVESLNVSVATALLLFEAKRQREAAGLYDHSHIPPDEYRKLLFEWGYPRTARTCQEKKLPYPDLDEDGYIVGM